MDDAAPAPPPPAAAADGMERKMSPGVVLLIAILAMVFFIVGLLNLLVQNLLRLRRARRRRRVGDADGSPTAFQGQLQQLFDLHDAGVDQAFVDALPVFPYRAIAGRDGGKEKDGDPFDCAVCLCEFAGDDKLRLLPTCGHAFHVPCIDAWLLSHSTCPLCRGSILANVEYSPGYSSPTLLVQLESEMVAGDGGDLGDRDGEEPPIKDAAEEIVEVKLGKLRCVDGNVSARSLAVDGTASGDGNGGRGGLGQRRCLSMGSYEYVMDEHAALRVAIKATPKRRAAGSWSRRRHALSASDFGGSNKKGAWETAVTEAAAAGDGAASLSLSKDSFSTSKIWMVVAARREEDDRRTAGSAGERRAASFRWPAMSAGCKMHLRGGAEATWDVEMGGGRGDNGAAATAEDRPSLARAAMLWVAGGRQGNHS